ncbi:hypothetical protein KC368_g1, partial [Hortaea werneckii]
RSASTSVSSTSATPARVRSSSTVSRPTPRRSARRRRRVSTCTSSASLLPQERPGLWTQRATSRSRLHRSLTTRTSKRI